MRWYVGYPILAAGLAFAFDTLFPKTPDLPRPGEVALPSPASEPPAPAVLAADIETPASRIAAFSPGAALASPDNPPAESGRGTVLDYLAGTLAPRNVAPPAPLPVLPVTATAWKSAVVRTSDAAPGGTAAQPRAVTPASRVALARDIQRELRRVGCYLGDIDGVWGGGSKRAMAVFMDRVNAALPAHEPDVFMLSLLRGQDAAVCGAACPEGQSLTAAGRCVPTTLMAQAGRPGAAAERAEPQPDAAPAAAPQAWAPVVADAGRRPPPPFGRMGIGGPVPPAEPAPPAAQAPGGAQTAALDAPAAPAEPALDGDGAPGAAPTSFDTAVAEPVRVRKARPSDRARRATRTSSYRHVQRIFEHPLGRM